jgi:hypothetical protein
MAGLEGARFGGRLFMLFYALAGLSMGYRAKAG